MRSKAARFVAATVALAWGIAGGFQPAHADAEHMDTHFNTPLAWMDVDAPGHAGHDASEGPDASGPLMPFLCHDGEDEGIAVAGASVPGALGASAGLVVLAQQSSPVPADDMTVEGIDELGTFPDVADDTLKEVTNNILCQCGCNLTVAACELAMVCDISKKMKYDAAVLLADEGMTPEEALDQFALEYGEKVLAAPTKEGINLVSWVLPFAGLAAGIALVGWALVGWRKKAPDTAGAAPLPQIDADVQARIDDEVNEGL